MRLRSKTKSAVESKINTIAALVDEAGALDEQIKIMSKRLATIKDQLKEHAEVNQIKTMEGKVYQSNITIRTQDEVDPGSLIKWLKDHNKLEMFTGLVKVAVTEVKNVLGTSVVEEIGRKTIGTPAISFRRRDRV